MLDSAKTMKASQISQLIGLLQPMNQKAVCHRHGEGRCKMLKLPELLGGPKPTPAGPD